MPILPVVKDVCLAVGVTVPVSLFAGIIDSRTMQEMLSLANEMAQRISYDTRDWTKLKKMVTLFGEGTRTETSDTTKTAFDLPADFKRMLLTSNVWKTSQTQSPLRFIPDTDEWMQRRASGYYDSRGEWTMLGGQIHVCPGLPAGTNAFFSYLHKNCIALASGGAGDVFLTDNDSFALDERVLKLAMIWQWKALKGSPYTEDMGTYGDALVIAMGHDSPSPVIVGRTPMDINATTYTWTVP